MFHVLSILLDVNSPLYNIEKRHLEFKGLMECHGLSESTYSIPDCRRAVFHHFLNGLCAYSNSSGCRMALNLSAFEISQRVFDIVRWAPLSVLTIACQSLGNFIDFEHQSRTPYDVLTEYQQKTFKFVSKEIQVCIYEIPSYSSSELLMMSAIHGLAGMGDESHLREHLLIHICYGGCFENRKSTIPIGCLNVQLENVDHADVCESKHFQAAVLHEAAETLNLKRLHHVLNCYKISYDSRWKNQQLRHYVFSIVDKLRLTESESIIEEPEFDDVCSSSQSHRLREWPEILPTRTKNDLIQTFKCATSSEALKTFTCACCGEDIFANQSYEIPVEDVNLDFFRSENGVLPISFPYTSGILKDLIVCPKGVLMNSCSHYSFIFCSECWISLRSQRLPSLALANDLYLGEIPYELQNLTYVEELMIALCRAKCSIFHLCESKRGSVSSISQTAFRGHIIIYPQNPSSVASFLPPPIEEITSLICILFVGASKPTLKWLHEKAKPLAVRANKVRDALIWLKKHNILYKDIVLNENVLHSLPDDGILPFYIEHISSSQDQDSLTSTYDNLRNVHNERDHSNDPIPFEKLVIADVEGHVNSNELRLAALKHIQKTDGSFLTIPHGPHPENEFNNPLLFPKMFPTLFPYGIGGFEDENRKHKISLNRHVKHLLKLNDKRFQEHHSFSFIAFNILQRRTVLLRTHLRTKKANFPSTAQMYDTITSESINHVIDRVSKGIFETPSNENDRRVYQLMQDVRLINSHVPGSSSARLQMRNEIRALTTYLGVPTFFITINPADIYSPILKYLALQNFDLDNMSTDDIPDYWCQGMLISRNPYVAAQFFNIFMKTFIETLLNYKSCSEHNNGVLGYVKGYYGCVEAQGRGSLHCHMLVWTEGCLNPNDLKMKVLTNDNFKEKLINYLEPMYHLFQNIMNLFLQKISIQVLFEG